MSVMEGLLESVFESGPVVDRVMTSEDRYQRKPSGTSDQGRCED